MVEKLEHADWDDGGKLSKKHLSNILGLDIESWKGFGVKSRVETAGPSGWRRSRQLEQEGVCQ